MRGEKFPLLIGQIAVKALTSKPVLTGVIERERGRNGDVVTLNEPINWKHDVCISLGEEFVRHAVLFVAEDKRRGLGEIPLGNRDGVGSEMCGHDGITSSPRRSGELIGGMPHRQVQPLVRALGGSGITASADLFV